MLFCDNACMYFYFFFVEASNPVEKLLFDRYAIEQWLFDRLSKCAMLIAYRIKAVGYVSCRTMWFFDRC